MDTDNKSLQNEVKTDEALPSVTASSATSPTTVIDSSNAAADQANQNINPDIIGKYFTVRASGDVTLGNYAGGQGIFWDQSAATLNILGGLSVSHIDIPDTITTNSFHVDTSGNSWWGSTTLAGSPASVTSTGIATFKSITLGGGTYQYTIADTGLYSFGDGSDGSVHLTTGTPSYPFGTWSGSNFTLTRDVFATDITIDNIIFLFTNGYRIFILGTLHCVAGASIFNQGNDASGEFGGIGLSSGFLSGSLGGGFGGGGGNRGNNSSGITPSIPVIPTGAANSIGTLSSAATSGTGGTGGAASGHGTVNGALGQTSGINTIYNVKPALYWHIENLIDINNDLSLAKYTSSCPATGGGGGGGGSDGGSNHAGAGGAGGGGGGTGGIIAIFARIIILDASCNISVKGGNGGNGTNGTNATGGGLQAGGGGGGGGGCGGTGGVIFMVYNQLTNNGTITIAGGTGGTAGTGGTGGAGGSNGGNGVDGQTGADGKFIQIAMSL